MKIGKIQSASCRFCSKFFRISWRLGKTSGFVFDIFCDFLFGVFFPIYNKYGLFCCGESWDIFLPLLKKGLFMS